jgi:hypothetical protein
MTQLSPASNQPEERKLSRDVTMRSRARSYAIEDRHPYPGVGVEFLLLLSNANGGHDYRGAIDGVAIR